MNGLRIATVSRSLPARALVKGRVLISRPSSLILPPTPSLSSPTSTSGGKRTLSSSVAGKILLGQPQKVLHQHINLSASLGSRRAFASLSTMTSLPKNDDGPHSSDMPSTQLILPPSETRPHRLITLPNNIQVILIHDPECDKAAAAMDVGVGHLEDPENLQGCAHFCEHLMFLGTKKYPEENAYSTYLSAHNGHSNAYTGLCSTNYYFDVAPDALEGALDRFSGFFTDPLFAEDCTEREANAVNSEHKKNLQSDLWRFYQLEKHLSSPSHPYSKFGTGDLKTLWTDPKSQSRDPRAELIEWWREKYCARRMKLVVLGRDSLETMEKWVRERFASVPLRTKPGEERIVYNSEVMTEEHMGSIVFANPVKDMRVLEITFPFPDQEHLFMTKPGNYLAHFLGHEGPGSILSSLKKHGWANSLRAGLSNGGIGFDFFKITVELTEDGLANYNKVALVIFKYIHLLKSTPPQERAFQEIKSLADIAFRFVERGQPASYVSELTTYMQQPVPPEKIISSQWLVEKFDAAEIEASLAHLDVRRSRMAITARPLPKDIGELNQTEPIYGTEYRVEKMSEDFIEEAMKGAVSSDLSLPGPNAFIPENLDVDKKEVAEKQKLPTLLRDNALSRVWYKKDDQFWIPRANLFVAMQSPLLDVTPRNATIGRLLCDLFRDSVTEKVYDAELAGLQFSIDFGGDHITLGTVGYNDKLADLTETMLKLFMEFKIDPERFELIKDQIKRGWLNFSLDEPYQLCAYYSHYVEAERMWTPQAKLAELDHITVTDVELFAKEFMGRLFLETLVHGNVTKEVALKIQDMVERVIKPRPLTAPERVAHRSLVLPDSSEYVWNIKVPNPANTNSSIDYYCQVGDAADDQLRNELALLAHIANEPCFNVLRTKEQLGYIVFSGSRSSAGQTGFRVLVQSEKDSVFLETRIEAFLDYFQTYLNDLSDEEFDKNRQSLVDKRLEKPKNLYGESSRFWARIGDGYYDFLRRDKDAEVLKAVTKDSVIHLFNKYIHPSSSTRSKISIHLQSQYTGVKFDANQAMPLVQSFITKGVPVSQESLQQLMATSPSLEVVQGFARQALEAAEGLSETDRKELEGGVAALGNAQVANGDEQRVVLRDGNVIITDIESLKASLRPSKAAQPVIPLKVEE